MKFKQSAIQLVFFLFFSFGASISAQASDIHSPRTAALGGSGHAGPLLNDSIFLNPSYVSFLPTYSMGFNYLLYNGPPTGTESEIHGRNYSVSIQDGRTESFQAGLAYSVRADGSFIHLGASKTVVQRLGFGLGAKFFFNPVSHTRGQDTTFSTTWAVTDWITAAAIVDNIFETDEGKTHGLYREFILGLKFNLKGIVLAYLDPHVVPSLIGGETTGYEAGLEFVWFTDFFLRVGMFRNAMIPYRAAYGRGYGIGVGWIAPRISLDYGISRAIEPVLETAHTLGATVYF